MQVLMLVWAVISMVSVGQIIYRSWKQKLVWKMAMFKLQTIAIGLLIFPFYWEISENLKLVCSGIGIAFLSVYAGTILLKKPEPNEEHKRPYKNRLREK